MMMVRRCLLVAWMSKRSLAQTPSPTFATPVPTTTPGCEFHRAFIEQEFDSEQVNHVNLEFDGCQGGETLTCRVVETQGDGVFINAIDHGNFNSITVAEDQVIFDNFISQNMNGNVVVVFDPTTDTLIECDFGGTGRPIRIIIGGSCPCKTPDSFFEDFVEGDIRPFDNFIPPDNFFFPGFVSTGSALGWECVNTDQVTVAELQSSFGQTLIQAAAGDPPFTTFACVSYFIPISSQVIERNPGLIQTTELQARKCQALILDELIYQNLQDSCETELD